MIPILECTFDRFQQEMADKYGRDRFVAADIYRQMFAYGDLHMKTTRNRGITEALLARLRRGIYLPPPHIVDEHREGDLIKFVCRLADSHTIESVVIPMISHYTLCVSSQVGCRMGCVFCETGRMGLVRNLTVEEITAQVFTAMFHYGFPIRNIVFMGMGEPLDNFHNVTQAIRILSDQRGFNIPMSRITLSTAGLVNHIHSLANLNWPTLHLAISLNAPNTHIRSRLMPINQTYPMEAIKEALLAYPLSPAFSFYIEYVVIKGINDSQAHCRELVNFLKPLPVWFNLIPVNPKSTGTVAHTTDADVDRFRDYLIQEKAFVRKRATRGRTVMSGCGQLGGRHKGIGFPASDETPSAGET